jgi:hypothetical protein
MVTVVNNNILYTLELLRVDCRCSCHGKIVSMWGNTHVNSLDLPINPLSWFIMYIIDTIYVN